MREGYSTPFDKELNKKSLKSQVNVILSKESCVVFLVARFDKQAVPSFHTDRLYLTELRTPFLD